MGKNKIFTVEYFDECVELHLNKEGLSELIEELRKLENNKGEDSHLLSDEWGGESLSSKKQNPNSMLIHHLKIFYW